MDDYGSFLIWKELERQEQERADQRFINNLNKTSTSINTSTSVYTPTSLFNISDDEYKK